MRRQPKGRVPTVLQRGPHQDLKAPRDLDKIMSSLGSMPRIRCWKCRKLTPFELDRCEHCGSALAGSTGGAYGSARKSRPQTTSVPKAASAPPKRSLLEIVEDLRHVNDATTSVRGRPREKEVSVRLYQCPTCGRFVSEQSTECVCGVSFAPMSSVTLPCPDCGSRVPSDVDACPACSRGFTPSGGAGDYVYACPRCHVHVASDAVRCSRGAWLEDCFLQSITTENSTSSRLSYDHVHSINDGNH